MAQKNVKSIQEKIEKVKQIFSDFLMEKSLRKTSERFAILEEIYKSDEHFDVESFYDQMKRQHYRVSRATVYNTLELLEECELVIKHRFGDSQAIYEKSHGFKQHDHLKCLDCGKVFEFCDPRISQIQHTIEENMHFKIKNHSLLIFAHCTKENCKEKKKNSK